MYTVFVWFRSAPSHPVALFRGNKEEVEGWLRENLSSLEGRIERLEVKW